MVPEVVYQRAHAKQLELLKRTNRVFLFALRAFLSIVVSGGQGGLPVVQTGAKEEVLGHIFHFPAAHRLFSFFLVESILFLFSSVCLLAFFSPPFP